MDAFELLRVLDALEIAGVRAGVTGGWGIDALLGRQTRSHADADLGIPAEAMETAIAALRALGYEIVTDARPARLVMQSPTGRLDLHPIEFDRQGHGVQTGLDGETFDYPRGSLDAEGTINSRTVRCGTPALQVTFHAHYEPRVHDIADMEALAAAFDLVLPANYRRA